MAGRGSRPASDRAGGRPRESTSKRQASKADGHGPFGILPRGEVSEWLMVPLSKSGVRKHRGFESHPLRQGSPRGRTIPALDPPSPRSRTSSPLALVLGPPWAGLAHAARLVPARHAPGRSSAQTTDIISGRVPDGERARTIRLGEVA